jgi:diaminopimelate epimerase
LANYWRYSATGNTFLFLDARTQDYFSQLKTSAVNDLCRQYSVDGMIFLESSDAYDFHMRYLNADGGEVEMCGNGARSITHFAHHVLEIKEQEKGIYHFSTHSSVYSAKIEEYYPVKMTELKEQGGHDIGDLYTNAIASYYVNTGVPHCVYLVDDVEAIDLVQVGRSIRMNERFSNGTNVNFYQKSGGHLKMRTYERGVEAETLSCGTGAVAVALCEVEHGSNDVNFSIDVAGGRLDIVIDKASNQRWLAGAVEITESGELSLK